MSKTRFGGTSPSALASCATTGRSLAAATSSAGSSTSPASACEPPAKAPKRQRSSRGISSPSAISGASATSASGSPPSMSMSLALPAADLDGAGVLLLGPRDRLDVGGLERLLEAPQRVAQLPLAEDLAQAGAVGAAGDLRLQVEVDGDVVDGRGELLGEPRGVGELGQVLLALGARDLVDAREHGLEVAEALQQVRRGLVPDARDAGDVVARVALEADEVGDQLGRDAVAVDHALAVVDLRVRDAPRGGHDPHPLVDELVGVAVAGDDHHGDLALLRLHDERGDHVVGLEALDRDVPVAERLHQRAQMRPLEAQQVGLARALGLVVGRHLLAARQAGVPHHDRRHLAVVGEDLHEHRSEAEDGVRGPPVRGRDRLREREERAVGERVPVDQEQLARGISIAVGHPPDTLCRARGCVGATSPLHPSIGWLAAMAPETTEPEHKTPPSEATSPTGSRADSGSRRAARRPGAGARRRGPRGPRRVHRRRRRRKPPPPRLRRRKPQPPPKHPRPKPPCPPRLRRLKPQPPPRQPPPRRPRRPKPLRPRPPHPPKRRADAAAAEPPTAGRAAPAAAPPSAPPRPPPKPLPGRSCAARRSRSARGHAARRSTPPPTPPKPHRRRPQPAARRTAARREAAAPRRRSGAARRRRPRRRPPLRPRPRRRAAAPAAEGAPLRPPPRPTGRRRRASRRAGQAPIAVRRGPSGAGRPRPSGIAGRSTRG